MAYSNNHYIPQFIQRRFGDKINRYNVQTGEIKVKGSILNAFSGKNIYELADVIVYCRNMLDKLGLDEDEIVNAKMEQNERKYPVSKARGKADKYYKL